MTRLATGRGERTDDAIGGGWDSWTAAAGLQYADDRAELTLAHKTRTMSRPVTTMAATSDAKATTVDIVRQAVSASEWQGLARHLPPRAHITGMRKWEGRVIAIDHDVFTVDLQPTTTDGAAVEADFDLDQLDPDDAPSLSLGDVVYVTVRTVSNGRRNERTAAIRLRRPGQWTESEVEDIDEDTSALRGLLDELAD